MEVNRATVTLKRERLRSMRRTLHEYKQRLSSLVMYSDNNNTFNLVDMLSACSQYAQSRCINKYDDAGQGDGINTR